MVRKKRVVAAVIVITVGTIAACLGPRLSSTEQQAVVIATGSTFDFGNVSTGSSATTTVTITPASGSSSSSDTITAISENCPAFSLVLMPLPAMVTRTCSGSGTASMPSGATLTGENATGTGDTCVDTNYSFSATFSPTLQGSASCTVTISGSTFSPLTLQLSGNGIAPALAIDVQPTLLKFGDIRVGNSGSLPVSIRNAGSGPLTINSVSVPASSGYSLTGTLGSHVIQAGISETVNVTCTPTSPIDFNSTLTVDSNAGLKTVALTCHGIMSDLVVNPSPIDVSTRIGDTATDVITLQNAGTASLNVTSATIVPTVGGIPVTITNTSKPIPFSIGSGGSETVTVQYKPTAGQMFAELAKLRIAHDGTMTRDVVINGAALETTMAIVPDTVDFGAVCANTTEMRDVEIKGGSPGKFQLTSFDNPSAPFMFRAKSGTQLPAAVLGNQENKLEFSASITPTAEGRLDGKVVLHSDIPGLPTRDLDLTAEVLAAGVGASPQTIDFGGLIKDTTSSAMMATVRNCSTTPLDVTSVDIEGLDAADFAIVLPPLDQRARTLAPQESVQYAVVMRSATPGAKIAQLVVHSAAGIATQVGLVGTALGGGDGTDGGERTYYSCKDCSGSGGGAGLLAVVVVLGLRRRRK